MSVLQEYLVRLGFQPDQASFGRFQALAQSAEQTVTTHAAGMAKHVLEAQASIVGAFTAISASIVGMMDKVAMADQGYRLMGLRMLMTTESARKLDMVTKALGADLPEIIWDPELHQRAVQMSEDIDRMTEALGPDFEKKMRGIRDFRFEFSRLEVATKFLGMQFVSSLFDKLMPGEAGDKIKRFVDWFEEKIPDLADKLASHAVPILKTTWHMIQEIGEVLKAAGLAFTNLVGLFSGDSSIEGATFSFEKMAKAIEHIGHWLTRFFGWVAHAEQILAHFASGMSLLLSGHFADALEEYKAGLRNFTGGSGAVIGGVGGAAVGGVGAPFVGGAVTALLAPEIGPFAVPVGAAAAAITPVITGAVGAGTVGLLGKLREWFGLGEEAKKATETTAASPSNVSAQNMRQGSMPPPIPMATGTRAELIAAINATADKYGVPRSLMLALAQHESGIQETDSRGRTLTSRGITGQSTGGALGVMQLMPDTAKFFGIDPNNALQNIEGGTRYMAMLLKEFHGDSAKALAAYSAGAGAVQKYNGIPPYAETRKAVPEILALQQQFERMAQQQAQPPQTAASAPPAREERTAAQQPASIPTFSIEPAGQTAPPSQQQAQPPTVEAPLFRYGSQDTPEIHPPAAAGERDHAAAAEVPGRPAWMERAPEWFGQQPTSNPIMQAYAPTMDYAPVMADMQRPAAPAPNVTSSSQSVSVDVGGIYVTHPGADEHQIRSAVQEGISNALGSQIQFDLVQASPAW